MNFYEAYKAIDAYANAAKAVIVAKEEAQAAYATHRAIHATVDVAVDAYAIYVAAEQAVSAAQARASEAQAAAEAAIQ